MGRKLWFTIETVKEIQKGGQSISFDLGRTFQKPNMRLLSKIPLDKIKENFVYAWDGKNLLKLALFGENFYKLRMWDGRPILEIDGLRMQLVKVFKNPMQYAIEVVQTLAINGNDTVLDTCMGLGYTAIEAAKKAKEVRTYEISEDVISLASWNPWSDELFSFENVFRVNGDIFQEIKKLPGASFSAIIHDPPRFSKAGNLYSLEFYNELARVSKPGARLFHYVGSLGKTRGRNIDQEIASRLQAAGWAIKKNSLKHQGVYAYLQKKVPRTP